PKERLTTAFPENAEPSSSASSASSAVSLLCQELGFLQYSL
ncbi:MAG: hypothetical protein ACI9OU_002788, partial [Candidatus Promineifilaceae bacterium]